VENLTGFLCIPFQLTAPEIGIDYFLQKQGLGGFLLKG
jgi:hypothetical protein